MVPMIGNLQHRHSRGLGGLTPLQAKAPCTADMISQWQRRWVPGAPYSSELWIDEKLTKRLSEAPAGIVTA